MCWGFQGWACPTFWRMELESPDCILDYVTRSLGFGIANFDVCIPTANPLSFVATFSIATQCSMWVDVSYIEMKNYLFFSCKSVSLLSLYLESSHGTFISYRDQKVSNFYSLNVVETIQDKKPLGVKLAFHCKNLFCLCFTMLLTRHWNPFELQQVNTTTSTRKRTWEFMYLLFD